MQNGIVKFFNETKGFGFISVEGGEDCFVHISDLAEGLHTLQEGDEVTFEAQDGKKGPMAVNVALA